MCIIIIIIIIQRWSGSVLTVVAPVGVPGVGHQPVRRSLLFSPAQDLHGMAAQFGPGHMLVNAWEIKQNNWPVLQMTTKDTWLKLPDPSCRAGSPQRRWRPLPPDRCCTVQSWSAAGPTGGCTLYSLQGATETRDVRRSRLGSLQTEKEGAVNSPKCLSCL